MNTIRMGDFHFNQSTILTRYSFTQVCNTAEKPIKTVGSMGLSSLLLNKYESVHETYSEQKF